MMWFMDDFVEGGEVKPSVNPIDTIIGEEQETKRRNGEFEHMKVGKEYAQWHRSN
jgi:hypothetical protein